MNRRVHEGQPGTLTRARNSKAESGAAATEVLKGALRELAEVRAPGDAEEPILAKPVRSAVLAWLREIEAAAELAKVGVKPRRSGMLFGPPGCGKTTLAHHLAARLGIPLVSVQSEQLVQSTLGSTGRQVARLFDAIEDSKQSCVLFIDELDAIGSTRSADDQACAREMNAALTTLLRKVESYSGMMIAATNRAEAIDPALWRRFSLHLDVALPDADERYAILKRYGEPYAFEDDDLDTLTDLTAGAAPSLLRELMESMKRTLVVGRRIGLDVDSPAVVFGTVIAATKPHADYATPPLWSGDLDAMLRGFSWPPQIPTTEDKTS